MGIGGGWDEQEEYDEIEEHPEGVSGNKILVVLGGSLLVIVVGIVVFYWCC